MKSFTHELATIPIDREGIDKAIFQIKRDLEFGLVSPELVQARFEAINEIYEAIKPAIELCTITNP